MKAIDSELIGARSKEIEDIVQEAMSVELLLSNGNTVEKIISKAKATVGLDESESLLADAADKLKMQYDMNNAFRNIVNFNARVKGLDVTNDEELALLLVVENRLAEKVAAKYDVDIEDLYVGGENE